MVAPDRQLQSGSCFVNPTDIEIALAERRDRTLAGGRRDVARAARLFPGSIETHNLVQDFFFGEDLMLRRHDYSVNIAGGFAAAQLTSDYVTANSIRLPPGAAPIRVVPTAGRSWKC